MLSRCCKSTFIDSDSGGVCFLGLVGLLNRWLQCRMLLPSEVVGLEFVGYVNGTERSSNGVFKFRKIVLDGCLYLSCQEILKDPIHTFVCIS